MEPTETETIKDYTYSTPMAPTETDYTYSIPMAPTERETIADYT